MTSERWIRVVEATIILVACLIALWGVRTIVLGDSLSSRLATVESLVHEGTWHIDRAPGETRSRFEAGTVDKVRLDGHLLSTKPPILPLLMTAEYWVMCHVADWRLDDGTHLKLIIQIMIVTLSVVPFALALVFFSRTLALLATPGLVRLVLLFMLAFGTQLIGFAPTLNNHVPAAAAVVVALYIAIAIGTGKRAAAPWRFVLFGVVVGLLFTLDMPVTIYAAFAGLYLLAHYPRRAVIWGGLGLALPLGVHFCVMWISTGSPLPLQLRGELYLYEGSPWRNPLGIDGLNEPVLTYLFGMTFGRNGTFLLFPVLLLGVAGTLVALHDKSMRERHGILAGMVAFLILTAYYATRTNNYGGEAYGFRWHLASMPVLLTMAAPMLSRWRSARRWVLVALLTVVSVFSAWECFQHPWSANTEWTARYLYGPSYGVAIRNEGGKFFRIPITRLAWLERGGGWCHSNLPPHLIRVASSWNIGQKVGILRTSVLPCFARRESRGWNLDH